MKHNIVSTMIRCPGSEGYTCDRVVTIEYDIESGHAVGEGCPHLVHFDSDDLLSLALDAVPVTERRLPRRGRKVPKHDPRVDEEGDWGMGK